MRISRAIFVALLGVAISPLLSAAAANPAYADFGGNNCRTVIRSKARGGNYTLCSPKGTMKCTNNRCVISKLPPASRTAGRPAKR